MTASNDKSGICGTTASVIMILVNFLLFVAAGFLIYVSVMVMIDSNTFLNAGLGTPLLFLSSGILILSFLGFCGAICKNRCMLWPYVIFLVILLIAEIALVVLAVVEKDHLKSVLEEVWDGLDATAQREIQSPDGPPDWNIDCCGFDGPVDGWGQALQYVTTETSGLPEEDQEQIVEDMPDDEKKKFVYGACLIKSQSLAGFSIALALERGTPIDESVVENESLMPPTCWDKYGEDIEKNLQTAIIVVSIVIGTKILLLISAAYLIRKSGYRNIAKDFDIAPIQASFGTAPVGMQKYCGVVSWIIGCCVPCGCWICFCPVDERPVYTGAVKQQPNTAQGGQWQADTAV